MLMRSFFRSDFSLNSIFCNNILNNNLNNNTSCVVVIVVICETVKTGLLPFDNFEA